MKNLKEGKKERLRDMTDNEGWKRSEIKKRRRKRRGKERRCWKKRRKRKWEIWQIKKGERDCELKRGEERGEDKKEEFKVRGERESERHERLIRVKEIGN